MSCELQDVEKRSILPIKLVAHCLKKIKKNNFRSFIYGQISSNPANFVKMGPVDAEISSPTKISKNIFTVQK